MGLPSTTRGDVKLLREGVKGLRGWHPTPAEKKFVAWLIFDFLYEPLFITIL